MCQLCECLIFKYSESMFLLLFEKQMVHQRRYEIGTRQGFYLGSYLILSLPFASWRSICRGAIKYHKHYSCCFVFSSIFIVVVVESLILLSLLFVILILVSESVCATGMKVFRTVTVQNVTVKNQFVPWATTLLPL